MSKREMKKSWERRRLPFSAWLQGNFLLLLLLLFNVFFHELLRHGAYLFNRYMWPTFYGIWPFKHMWLCTLFFTSLPLPTLYVNKKTPALYVVPRTSLHYYYKLFLSWNYRILTLINSFSKLPTFIALRLLVVRLFCLLMCPSSFIFICLFLFFKCPIYIQFELNLGCWL